MRDEVPNAWRLAFTVAVAASLVMTLAFIMYNSQSTLGLGRIGKWCLFVAAPGFLGYVVGMFASGNAHVGGPYPVVVAVATVFNVGLYTLVAYGIIRLGQLLSRRRT
jgi:hypothetical protein